MGVPTPPCVVGEVVSGKPAWQADLRPSDEILAIAGRNMRQFRDLQTAISLGSIDPKTGVQLTVRRPGVAAPFPVPVMPDHTIGAFFIGVSLPSTTTLVRDRKTWLVKRRFAAIPGSAADLARPAFRCGDRIVQIDDAPISDFGQIEAQLARTADRPIQVTVERAPKAPAGEPERLRIAVAPSPMRDLGLVMTMGEIAAVQKDSPAEAAGIKAGDLITHYDGHPVGDPMRLPDRLDRLAGKTVRLTVQRKGETGPIQISARLRQPIDLPPPLRIGAAVTVSSLGVAYRILNKVERVVDGGPAARSGLRAGDSIVRAKITPPSKEVLRKLEFDQSADVLPEQEGDDTWWPAMMAELQTGLPGTNVELRYVHPGSKEPITAELTPADAADWCNPERGFLFEPMTFDLRADSVGDAMMLGGRETLDALTLVYRTVGAISTTQVSLRMIAGPKTIVMVALESADQGTARLLLFLTLLSANLAVLNFLPIPLLDGGHFVLLCYEGIRGKPAPESVQIVLSYIGLTLVLALMVWALGLDFGVFARH
jgi:regulator of sigma E protease